MIGILAEKPSAMRNMAKALGGVSGTYNGEAYTLVAARGHLYGFVNPDKQVAPALAAKYGKWDLDSLPWDEKDFQWKYAKKKDSDDTLKQIKSVLSKCSEVVIATDDDPTGEGELLAWEILDQLNIAPKVFSRMYFADESAKEIQKSFVNRKNIPSMDQDMDYVKALYRTKWDFLSMQFTRIATKCGDGVSILRQGRLKSAMVLLVGDQLKAVAGYKKVPHYQNRFKDENGVVYTNPDEPTYPKKDDVPNTYHSSDVVLDSKTMKSTAPPKLLDLAALSSRLVSSGYTAKQIMDVYQKMYEAQIVSYPRTEDKVITPEQFDELLPLVDNIAQVVGVDKALLTHRTPRSTHVKTGGAHGANRPGTNVPKKLSDLTQYGPCGPAIYEMLAKNYLATLAEDYEYEAQKGHVKDYPDFKGSASIPKKMGWKLVFNDDAEPADDDNAKGIGTKADPFVYEGFPPKPATPTMKWLMAQLEKRDVGTGATRTSTYAEVTKAQSATNKYPLMKDTKGKISMTQYGEMSYRLLPDTNIGSLDMTEKLMNEMRDIATGKKNPDDCLKAIQKMVLEDIETMKKNSVQMRKDMNITSAAPAKHYKGIWNGKEVSFKQSWSGHDFTDEECEKLCNGETITIEAVSKDGKPFKCTGCLELQTFKGKKFVGFSRKEIISMDDKMRADKYEGTWNGKAVKFKKEWSGHKFTDDECEKLCNGDEITIEAVSSKTGKSFKCTGVLAEQTFNDRKYIGFKSTGFVNSSGKSNGVPDEWCKHKFTDEEKTILESGLSIEADDFVSNGGKKFGCKVHFGKNDRGYMSIIPDFD